MELAEWVFQCDRDGEMWADSFRDLWEVHGQMDGVLGYRQNRKQTLQRRVISFVSRAMVGLLFDQGVTDVNTPYRLLRASALRRVLPWIPLALLGLIGVSLVLAGTSRYGVGLSPDSTVYVSVARNLLAGRGYVTFDGAPIRNARLYSRRCWPSSASQESTRRWERDS